MAAALQPLHEPSHRSTPGDSLAENPRLDRPVLVGLSQRDISRAPYPSWLEGGPGGSHRSPPGSTCPFARPMLPCREACPSSRTFRRVKAAAREHARRRRPLRGHAPRRPPACIDRPASASVRENTCGICWSVTWRERSAYRVHMLYSKTPHSRSAADAVPGFIFCESSLLRTNHSTLQRGMLHTAAEGGTATEGDRGGGEGCWGG